MAIEWGVIYFNENIVMEKCSMIEGHNNIFQSGERRYWPHSPLPCCRHSRGRVMRPHWPVPSPPWPSAHWTRAHGAVPWCCRAGSLQNTQVTLHLVQKTGLTMSLDKGHVIGPICEERWLNWWEVKVIRFVHIYRSRYYWSNHVFGLDDFLSTCQRFFNVPLGIQWLRTAIIMIIWGNW